MPVEHRIDHLQLDEMIARPGRAEARIAEYLARPDVGIRRIFRAAVEPVEADARRQLVDEPVAVDVLPEPAARRDRRMPPAASNSARNASLATGTSRRSARIARVSRSTSAVSHDANADRLRPVVTRRIPQLISVPIAAGITNASSVATIEPTGATPPG